MPYLVLQEMENEAGWAISSTSTRPSPAFTTKIFGISKK
jgi:hypothetical protein